MPLTQLTLYYCYLKESLLLSKVSDTLELLIIESGKIYEGSGNDDFQLGNLQPLQFPRLKTLILADMFQTKYFFILSIIQATNLVELGINRAWCDDPKKHCFVELFIDLIKANLKLKIVQFPREITEMFLADTLENPEVEYHFEELSFSLYVLPFGDVMNFLELQRNSLKSLRIEYARIDEDNFERLLSFDLVRLELLCCSIEVPQDAVIQNSSIRSLVFFESERQNFEPETFSRFFNCFTNLSACAALIKLNNSRLLPQNTMTWKSISMDEMKPEKILFSELRSLRFAGLNIAKSMVKDLINGSPKLLYYSGYDKMKEVLTVENHPFSLIRFESKDGTRDMSPRKRKSPNAWNY